MNRRFLCKSKRNIAGLRASESREVKGEPYAKEDTELARRLILLHEAALVFPRNVHV